MAWLPHDGRSAGLLILAAFYLACAVAERLRPQRPAADVRPCPGNPQAARLPLSRTLAV
jgi:hypothetical protein